LVALDGAYFFALAAGFLAAFFAAFLAAFFVAIVVSPPLGRFD
jgi:predicted PurR-regulated permease PerM